MNENVVVKKNKINIFLVILTMLALLGCGGLSYYTFFMKDNVKCKENTSTNKSSEHSEDGITLSISEVDEEDAEFVKNIGKNNNDDSLDHYSLEKIKPKVYNNDPKKAIEVYEEDLEDNKKLDIYSFIYEDDDCEEYCVKEYKEISTSVNNRPGFSISFPSHFNVKIDKIYFNDNPYLLITAFGHFFGGMDTKIYVIDENENVIFSASLNGTPTISLGIKNNEDWDYSIYFSGTEAYLGNDADGFDFITAGPSENTIIIHVSMKDNKLIFTPRGKIVNDVIAMAGQA